MTRRGILAGIKTAFIAFVAITLYANLGPQPEPVEIVRTDTATARAYRDMWKDAEKRNTGLRAKLEGVKTVKPTTRTVYDTIVKYIDKPVAEQVLIAGGTIQTLTLVPDSGGFIPTRDTYRINNCDDRLEYTQGKLVCDPARLGHLVLFARVGVRSGLANGTPDLGAIAHAGLVWSPSFRSTHAVELYGDGQGRAYLALRTGLRIF